MAKKEKLFVPRVRKGKLSKRARDILRRTAEGRKNIVKFAMEVNGVG